MKNKHYFAVVLIAAGALFFGAGKASAQSTGYYNYGTSSYVNPYTGGYQDQSTLYYAQPAVIPAAPMIMQNGYAYDSMVNGGACGIACIPVQPLIASGWGQAYQQYQQPGYTSPYPGYSTTAQGVNSNYYGTNYVNNNYYGSQQYAYPSYNTTQAYSSSSNYDTNYSNTSSYAPTYSTDTNSSTRGYTIDQ